MFRVVSVIAALYLLLTALVFVKQRSMLYQPSQHGLTTTDASDVNLMHWPSEKEYRGYLSDKPDSEFTIVVFHGNAGEAADRHYYVSSLSTINARIILAEYPGYGKRQGTPTENTLVSDARTTLNLIIDTYPNQPLIVIGESMGAGVASAAATKSTGQVMFDNANIKGLALITPWDSLSNLARHYFWYLPTKWLLLDHYDSENNLKTFNSPVAVVIAGEDQIIPASHANALYRSVSAKKARFLLESAGHNDWLAYVDSKWWEELIGFLTSDPLEPNKINKNI